MVQIVALRQGSAWPSPGREVGMATQSAPERTGTCVGVAGVAEGARVYYNITGAA